MVGLVNPPPRTSREGYNNQPPVWTNATMGNVKQINQHYLKSPPFINPTGNKAMPGRDFELARTSSDFALNLVRWRGGFIRSTPLLIEPSSYLGFHILGSWGLDLVLGPSATYFTAQVSGELKELHGLFIAHTESCK